MVNVYEKSDYRSLIQALMELGQLQTPRLTLSAVARKIQIQPSYLTNVLKNRSDLNTDQLFQILHLFELNDDEIQFGLDLLEWERSSHPKRRSQLKERIKAKRDAKLRAEHFIAHDPSMTSTPVALTLQRYYLDPLFPIIHMYFGLDKVETNFKILAENLQIPEHRLTEIIKYLQQENLIEFKQGRYRLKKDQLHLPKDSPLTKAHQLGLKSLALEHFLRSDTEKHYSFMASFNGNPEVKLQIQVEFLKFIKKCQALSNQAPAENITQLNFELFNWEV